MTHSGRKLVAVVHADMVAYSRLIGMDDVDTLKRLRALRTEVIDPAIAAHSGRIVQTGGDSLLIVFDSIEGAVRCAVTVQQQVPNSDKENVPDRRIRFRMGIDIGDAIADGTDLHGDGVIVAARLQAECPPGGVCVSRAVRDHVHDRLDLSFETLGLLTLKNIARPVEAFLVHLDAPSRTPKPAEQSLVQSEALPLPDKPSIAVLPFQNMSGDPEQEYFADGMVEEITTALSRIPSLFVIARNSAFTYKGRAVDVRQVGRELGVRYVLEGSVRKAGSRVRITGQLVEASTGSNVWADRFDGTLADVFDLQDQVAARVAGAIRPNLLKAEIERAQRKPPEDLQAYDCVLRSMPLHRRRSREDLIEAEALLRRAIEIDPNYALALVCLAYCHFTMVAQHWADHSSREIAEQAQAAMQLNGADPEVLYRAGYLIALSGGDMASGIAIVNKSIELNPNSAAALQTVGSLYAFAGDKQTAIICLEKSVRLSPLDRSLDFYLGHAAAHFVAGEYEATIEWTGEALRQVLNHVPSLRYRAASLGLLGRQEEGRQVAQRLLALVPNFTITRLRRFIEFEVNNVFKTPGVADALYEGLRRCGVPE